MIEFDLAACEGMMSVSDWRIVALHWHQKSRNVWSHGVVGYNGSFSISLTREIFSPPVWGQYTRCRINVFNTSRYSTHYCICSAVKWRVTCVLPPIHPATKSRAIPEVMMMMKMESRWSVPLIFCSVCWSALTSSCCQRGRYFYWMKLIWRGKSICDQ